MVPPHPALDRVRRTVAARLRGQRVQVFLFGSWARGEPRRTSDIDVAVLPERDLDPGLLAALREELAELPVPYTVDLVDLREAAPSLRAKVLREGVRWSV